MLRGEAGRSMHETVWKSPLIQDFPAWANWWNSSWNTGNHFTRQTFLMTETGVACPLTQWYYIDACYFKAVVKEVISSSKFPSTVAVWHTRCRSVQKFLSYSMNNEHSSRRPHTFVHFRKPTPQNYKVTHFSTGIKSSNKHCTIT